MKRFLVALHTFALAIACLSVPFAIFIVLRYAPARIQVPGVTNADLLSTILTALAIILGTVAVMIAGLAIWGYHAIKDEARDIAVRVARRCATKYMKSTEGQAQLREEARKIALDEIAKLIESNELSSAFQSAQIERTMGKGEDKENPVGKPYPKGKKQ